MRGTRSVVLAILLTTACSHGASAQDPGALAASTSSGVITLGTGPIEVMLVVPPDSRGSSASSVAERLRSVEAGRQIYLTFARAQAQAAPGITYNVYLGLPANATPQGTTDSHYAGTLNFYNATGRPLDMSLNITSQVARLLTGNDIGDSVRVTIVPAGQAATTSPQIGGIRITSR
jgi:hypothetical protein